jgi:hypothetical protein
MDRQTGAGLRLGHVCDAVSAPLIKRCYAGFLAGMSDLTRRRKCRPLVLSIVRAHVLTSPRVPGDGLFMASGRDGAQRFAGHRT